MKLHLVVTLQGGGLIRFCEIPDTEFPYIKKYMRVSREYGDRVCEDCRMLELAWNAERLLTTSTDQ